MPVNTPRPEYREAESKWERVRDCYHGSDAVKAKRTKYLPALDSQKPGTDQADSAGRYNEYILRALFYNATGRTVDGLSGVVLQKPPKLAMPDALKEDTEDVTLTGVSLETFALKIIREILITGRCGVLIDMSAKESVEPRPYWTRYDAEEIVNWSVNTESGDSILTRVVLCEHYDVPKEDDEFVSVSRKRYRVLELVEGVYSQTVWEPEYVNGNPTGKYTKGESTQVERKGKALDFIPFVFIGSITNTTEIEKPPLLDLADVNLSHYRTSADLEHGRHFTALPTPWVSGLVGGETGKLFMGSGTAWVLDPNGRAGMLEFSGAGLSALVTADDSKRKMMATLGARLLEENPSSTRETATGVMMRHSGETASMKTIAGAVETALTDALQWHAYLAFATEEPADEKIRVELNKDFYSDRMEPTELSAALAALQANAISYKTFYSWLEQGELARPGVTADEEQDEIQKGMQDAASVNTELYGTPNPGVVDPPQNGEDGNGEDGNDNGGGGADKAPPGVNKPGRATTAAQGKKPIKPIPPKK